MYIVYLVMDINSVSGGMRVIFEHANGLSAVGHKVEIWANTEQVIPYFKNDVQVELYDVTRLAEPDVVVMPHPLFVTDCARYRGDKRTFILMQHDVEWLAMHTNESSFTDSIYTHKSLFIEGLWGIIAVSGWVRDIVVQKYGITPELITNGVDTETFHPTDSLLHSERPSVLLYYDPQLWKGYDEAVHAALRVKDAYPELVIMLMGCFFPQSPAGQTVGFGFPAVYFARPEQSEIAAIYASATVFVSASWKEGFGMPGLEAMACGTAVVTTDSGGVREYAKQNETALLSQPQDIDALAANIAYALTDKEARKQRVRNGLLEAHGFSWPKSIRKLERLFE